MKPLLKRVSMLAAAGEVILGREPGVQWTLSDPDGQVLALLQLLDGSLTLDEVARALSLRWPDLTREQVAERIIRLDEAGLLEDDAAESDLTLRQLERYAGNLAFFGTFAGLAKSRYRFQEKLQRSHVVVLGAAGLQPTLLRNLTDLGVGRVTLLGDGPAGVAALLAGADLVLRGALPPASSRDWVNEACISAGVPWIAGGMQAGRGLYYSVLPGASGCGACLQLWRSRTAQDGPMPCPGERTRRGMGPISSLMGSLVALEAVRYLTRFAPPVSAGRLWRIDFATGDTAVALEWPRLQECPVCGHLTGAGRP